jgi:hypothetical protein
LELFINCVQLATSNASNFSWSNNLGNTVRFLREFFI